MTGRTHRPAAAVTAIGVEPEDLPLAVRGAYSQFWILPDGRLCGLVRLLYHWTVHVDIDPIGYSDRYCFMTAELAIDGMNGWDGCGDPINWHKHPKTGRIRPDRTAASEYLEQG
jgi:hypothetical protein